MLIKCCLRLIFGSKDEYGFRSVTIKMSFTDLSADCLIGPEVVIYVKGH